MIDWHDFRFMLALHRCGSIRGAARTRRVNHAIVSRRITAVNRQLGAAAFERIDGDYRTTDQGETLIAAAQRMEDSEFTAARQSIGLQLSMSGLLVLSLPDVVARHLLMEELGNFTAGYPEIDLTVETLLGFDDLDRRQADLVVRISNAPSDHLVGRWLFKYAQCCYAAPHYLAATDRAICAGSAGPAMPNGRIGCVRPPYPDVPVGLLIKDPLVRHDAARNGLSLVFEACFLADTDPPLKRLSGAMPLPDRDIWILTHPDTRETPKIAALFRHLVRAIAARRTLIEGAEPQAQPEDTVGFT